MIHHAGGQLHFRCCFDISPTKISGSSWSEVIREVRKWISGKLDHPIELDNKWFFYRGEWKPKNKPRYQVSTISACGGGSDNVPEYWAVRFQEPDSEIRHRQWRTDIGIQVLSDNKFRFSLTTIHSLSTSYIGEEPQNPLPSAPRIVTNILSSPRWRCYLGSDEVIARAEILGVGNGPAFKDRLIDRNRIIPYVLVSVDYDTGKPKINCERLSRLLAGSALVYEMGDVVVEDELKYYIPKPFRCSNGMVRVYLSPVVFRRPNDFRRHRFFTKQQINEKTSSTIEDMIVSGIVRRGGLYAGDVVENIEDVSARERECRINDLKRSIKSDEAEKLFELYSEEISHLYERIKERDDMITDLKIDILDRDERLGAKEDELSGVRFEKDQACRRCDDIKKEKVRFEDGYNAICNMGTLPERLSDVLVLVEKLQRGRIVFTERAKKSADDASFRDVHVAWKCLWSMATILHDLYFKYKYDAVRIAKEYQAMTSFEMTFTEGKQTKADKRIMASRRDEYEGEVIDITPHVKIGSKEPKLLRVHFYAQPKKQMIIVGHCGDHLDTYATRKKH